MGTKTILILLLSVGSGPVWASVPSYQAKILDLNGFGIGSITTPYRLNNRADVVASLYTPEGTVSAVFPSGGPAVEILGTEGDISIPYDINDSGVVVGYAGTFDGRPVGSGSDSLVSYVLYPDAAPWYTRLNTVQGDGYFFPAINNQSVVAADAFFGLQVFDQGEVYRTRRIGLGGIVPGAINDRMEVVGSYLYRQRGDSLGLFIDRPEGTETYEEVLGLKTVLGTDITETGVVAGWASLNDEQRRENDAYEFDALGFTMIHGVATALLPPKGFRGSFAESINEDLWVVGGASGGAGVTAMLWVDGVGYNLNDLVNDPSLYIYQAFDINDHGQILALAFDEIDLRLVLLTPVPEPTSLLAVVGLASLARHRTSTRNNHPHQLIRQLHLPNGNF